MNKSKGESLTVGYVFILMLLIICWVSPITAATYELGIGDVLQISVWGHSELNTSVEVRPDGYITFPLVGDHYVVGKSTSQLAAEIQNELENFVVDPSVTVMVREFRTIRVQVLGEVRNPGYYTLRTGDRIMDALGLAGGPTEDANLVNVTLTRVLPDSAEIVSLDIDNFIKTGTVDNNPVLENQDVIHLAAAGNGLVLGAVRNPGSYRIQGEMDILDLVALSGGILESADLSQATLTRRVDGEHQEIPINLEQVMASGKGSWTIGPDDVLYIPEQQKVVVLGEVMAPGNYSLETGKMLLEVIGAAGGLTAVGDATQVSIVRNIDDQQQLITVDISSALKGSPGGENPVLVGGDLVFVPEAMNNILVLGEVRQPGSFVLREQMGVLDVLAMAGSTTDRAALDRVTLSRQNEDQVLIEEIDVAKLQQTGTGRDISLQAGDVLFVPEGAPQALVLGQVRNPGSYRVHSEMQLLDLLALAGGALESAGDQLIITRDNQQIEVNLGALSRLGISNLRIEPGDIAYVTEGRNQVLVLGEVQNPGYHYLDFGDRVLDGIAKAGGLLDGAAASQVSLTRQTEDINDIYDIDLQSLMSNRYLDSNITLEGGDVIIVPKADRQIMVLGQVHNPGYYYFEEGQHLLELIASAGGMTQLAASDKVQLTRSSTDEESSTNLYNLDNVIQGLGGINPVVQSGDIVYVPERRTQVLVFGEVVSPGYYPVSATTHLLDIIAQAGGLTNKAAANEVSLSRDSNDETIVEDIDLAAIMETGKGNIPLTGGEMILVPERKTQVLVFGEVSSPGYYPVTATTHLLDAIAQAGGLTDRAAANEVNLSREVNGETDVDIVDVAAIMETGKGNIPLTGGEMILVPELSKEVLVLGEVVQPGMYSIRQGERVLDVLAKAGGVKESADAGFTLTRNKEGTQEVVNIELARLLQSAHSEENYELNAGDVIYVPLMNRRILVFGEVRNPGAYLVDQYTTLLDVIALAGGTTERAVLEEISVTSGGTDLQIQQIDLNAVISQQQPNLTLTGGEVINVPASREILVIGEVTRPGSFVLPREGRILDLLALAGGINNNSAHQEIILTRQHETNEQVWVMDYQTLVSDQSEHNYLLTGGDVLFIPEMSRQVLVLGEVNNPGVYTIYEGARVLDAIALAGGPTGRAALETVGIYRGGSIGSSSTLAMGEDRMLFEGDVQENPEIRGGDLIYVPETSKPDWNQIFGFMGGVRTFQQIIEWFINL